MNRVCAIHTRGCYYRINNVGLGTILQSLQAEQYVGFINLPTDLNDWLPENIHTYSKIQIFLYNLLP